jgi:hypothetical protein
MKISNLRLDYKDVALGSRPIALPIISAFKRGLQQIIQYLNSGNELKVWTTRARDGEIRWHAYDRVSDRRVVTESEAQMRAWVEERYYY